MTLKEFLEEKNAFDKFKANVIKIVPEHLQAKMITDTEQEGYKLEHCFPFVLTYEGNEFWQELKHEFNFINNSVSLSINYIPSKLKEMSNDTILSVRDLTENTLIAKKGSPEEDAINGVLNCILDELKTRGLNN